MFGGGDWAAILNEMVEKGLPNKVTFEERTE